MTLVYHKRQASVQGGSNLLRGRWQQSKHLALTLTNVRYQFNEIKIHTKIIPTKLSLFDGTSDHKPRSITRLILGCDVNAKGILDVGESTLNTEIYIFSYCHDILSDDGSEV